MGTFGKIRLSITLRASDMSDLETGKTFQHLLVAAVASALVVFGLKAGADKLLSSPPPAVSVKRTTVVVEQSLATAEIDAAQVEAERLASLAKQERLKKEKEQSELERVKRELKLQDALASRAANAERQRRDASWQRFYKKPKKCDNPSDNAIIVECSNHYLREEQRFEKLYADGKL